jgi:hypothetical protein
MAGNTDQQATLQALVGASAVAQARSASIYMLAAL